MPSPNTIPTPAPERANTLAVIIGGGQARRLGFIDKGALELGGHRCEDWIKARLRPQAQRVLVNRPQTRATKDSIADALEGFLGPLSGVLGAMRYAQKKRFPYLLTTSLDAPFIPLDLRHQLSLLFHPPHEADIAYATSEGRRHPLCALWRTTLADALEHALVAGTRKIEHFTAGFKTHAHSWEKIANTIDPFFNINTQQDLKQAQLHALFLRQHEPALIPETALAPAPSFAPGLESIQHYDSDDIDRMQRQFHRQHQPDCVFCYGSLIGETQLPENRRQRRAKIFSYHRAASFWSTLYRGTPQNPGLVLALRRGGSCLGAAIDLNARDHADADNSALLRAIWQREMVAEGYKPVLVTCFDVDKPHEPAKKALSFALDENSAQAALDLSFEQKARIIANASGDKGANVDYFIDIERRLDAIDIHDAELTRLTRRLIQLQGQLQAQAPA